MWREPHSAVRRRRPPKLTRYNSTDVVSSTIARVTGATAVDDAMAALMGNAWGTIGSLLFLLGCVTLTVDSMAPTATFYYRMLWVAHFQTPRDQRK